MDPNQPVGENYANPRTCFFHVLFKVLFIQLCSLICIFIQAMFISLWHNFFSGILQAASLAFYILSALFIDNFVIIFVVTVLLAALDFWVVKNVSGRILVGLRWWNEINDLGESVWKFECLDHESLSRMNKKDSWLFWWTLYLTAIAWIFLAIFSLIRLQADYLLVVGVCLTLSIANIVGFTKCKKDAKKQIQQFASQTIATRFSSTLQSAFSVV
ncbi:Golgi apparatus membrane protein-like protein ECHIDNA isoform X1 [Vigna unguiculata]|uniref:Golgi apparatus membrane protein-like protein ECHIDNA isoform X1 n=1 Tax=Vigna unguiculata TaxID=3917 RepID=UPI001016506F|nr:Golgi apparatus membrane protein-like protein ECHIDNA isoform X1 [Vigna unguiculata]